MLFAIIATVLLFTVPTFVLAFIFGLIGKLSLMGALSYAGSCAAIVAVLSAISGACTHLTWSEKLDGPRPY